MLQPSPTSRWLWYFLLDFGCYDCCRCVSINCHVALASDVVVYPVCVFLAFDGGGDVKVLKQKFFAVFKDAPDVIHCAATILASAFVEPNLVRVHTISAAGGTAQACGC